MSLDGSTKDTLTHLSHAAPKAAVAAVVVVGVGGCGGPNVGSTRVPGSVGRSLVSDARMGAALRLLRRRCDGIPRSVEKWCKSILWLQ